MLNPDFATRSPWMSHPVPPTPPLASDLRADVCVVGAGIAGLSVAYFCAKKGMRVVVLDDGPVAGGMTGRTTAHLMTAVDDRYLELERIHGEDKARLAAESHRAAVDAIEAICRHEGIECDFARVDGYLFTPPDGDPEVLVEEYAAALRAGVEGVEWVDRAPMDGVDSGRCLRFPRQGQFHPVKYAAGLVEAIRRLGGEVYSQAHVLEVEGGDAPRVKTRGGFRVDCGAAVVATNTPITDRIAIHTKQAPYMTYVVALRVPRGTVPAALLWDTRDDYHYVRLDKPDGELLIVGGQDHKTGQADDAERRFALLELWARERFPMCREVLHRWSGQVMETVDHLAYIGRDPGSPNVFVATGDSGMGMTHGTIAGILITDLIHGADIAWTALYDPSRITLKAAGAYARENANVAMQYASWIRPGEVDGVEEIAAGQGAVVRRGVHKLAVYRDPAGQLHEMSARCTHLGCVVAWNSAEATWDCPCHGSRFDATGAVVSGPAVTPLESVEKSPPGDVRIARQATTRPPTAPPPH